MKYRDPCGCTHDGVRWLKMCEPHETETRALHERANAEHRGLPPPVTPVTDWLGEPVPRWGGTLEHYLAQTRRAETIMREWHEALPPGAEVEA